VKVAIFGSGVGGMSAAHELIERGFEVDIYDRLTVPGGKARSVIIDTDGQRGLPGEHGFRFFPGFYRHVIDTMSRIPLDGGGFVVDNLVAASMGFFAHEGGPPLHAPSIGPRSLGDVFKQFADIAKFRTVLSDSDIEFFVGKMWQIMTSCDERRLAEYELVSWVDFIEAETRSPQYQMWFAGAMTRTLIAASGDKASSRTVGDILVTLMLGGAKWGATSDRLLNGPTNEVWMNPWRAHLEAKGVHFHFGEHLVEFDLAAGPSRPELCGAIVEGPAGRTRVTADLYLSAVPIEVMAPLITDSLAVAAPSLKAARTLGPNVAWMSGIQIYLRNDVPIVNGHVAFSGSPWGLTAISQQQFWTHQVVNDADHGVRGVLSIDLSDWNSKGHNGLTARQCTPDVLVHEVLDQIRRCLPELDPSKLADTNIHSFFIDPDIVFFGSRADPNAGDDSGAAVANHEPLFINQVGTHDVRPHAYCEISNLFLASDYVRTNTDLATMEGANEAARRAVNAILTHTNSAAPRCQIWAMHQPRALGSLRWLDRRRFHRGEPWTAHFPAPLRWASHLLHRASTHKAR
jgi:15-cis-phytoene desaturase